MNDRLWKIVEAARVPKTLSAAERFPWQIVWHSIDDATIGGALRSVIVGHQPYCALHHWTERTALSGGKFGECVMDDSNKELKRHVQIWRHARGRVLVTGLGLGCVVRGLLAKRDVEHVDVVELDPWILETIGAEFAGDRRVTLREGDALKVKWPKSACWDFAWHDLWTATEVLDLLHVKLIIRMQPHCPRQGAWGMDRSVKRRLPEGAIG